MTISKVYTGAVPISEHLDNLSRLYNHNAPSIAAKKAAHEATQPPQIDTTFPPNKVQSFEIQRLKRESGLES